MPELRIHKPIEEIDQARLPPALRGRARAITPPQTRRIERLAHEHERDVHAHERDQAA